MDISEQMKVDQLFHSLLKNEIQSFGQIKSFKTGDVILQEESYIQIIPIVLKGSLRVMRTGESGHEMLLYYIRPGESCIMSFLGGIHHESSKVNAVVEEDAELLLIPVSKAGEWIKEFPEWTDFIFQLYHKRFEELLEVVNAIAFQKLDDRIMNLLKQKAELFKTKELKITHHQLAEELGSTREVVSRLLKQLESEGKIKSGRNKILVM